MTESELKTQTDMYTVNLIEFAWQFDDQYTKKIDKLMCTDECPCYRGKNDFDYNTYKYVSEDTLSSHGRQRNETSGLPISKKPLKWSTSQENSYKSI